MQEENKCIDDCISRRVESRRTFKTRSPAVMVTLWKSLVLPHRDYFSQLWSPSIVKDIQKLETLQRSFIRKIAGMQSFSYWNFNRSRDGENATEYFMCGQSSTRWTGASKAYEIIENRIYIEKRSG